MVVVERFEFYRFSMIFLFQVLEIFGSPKILLKNQDLHASKLSGILLRINPSFDLLVILVKLALV